MKIYQISRSFASKAPLLLIFAICLIPVSSIAASWESATLSQTMCIGAGCPKPQPASMQNYFKASPVYASATGQAMPNSQRGVCRVDVPGNAGQYVPGYFELRIPTSGGLIYINCKATLNGQILMGPSDYLRIEAGETLAWGTTEAVNAVDAGPGPSNSHPNRVCRARRQDATSSPDRLLNEWFVGHEGQATCLYAYQGREESSGPNYEVLVENVVPPNPPTPVQQPRPIAGGGHPKPPPPPPIRNCSLPAQGMFYCGQFGGRVICACASTCARGYHAEMGTTCVQTVCNSEIFTPQYCGGRCLQGQ